MKKLFSLFIALLTVTALTAQQPYTAYCSLSGGSYSQLDYGQESLAKNTLVDENGKPIYFNSFIGMLNYMSQRGWKYEFNITSVNSNILDSCKIESSTKLIFSKSITSKEEITEGILTRQMLREQNAE
jgi:hypothetical protein